MESKSTYKKTVKNITAKRAKKHEKPSAITKDNPGRIKNRPTSHLGKEDYLQVKVNLLELDKVRLETQNISKQIDSNEKANYILRMRLGEKKRQEQSIKNEQLAFIEEIKKKTGIDIKGKSLDFITGEVDVDLV